MTSEHHGFPHPAYAKHVLEPQYQAAKDHIFSAMLDANDAHVIMLTECGVIGAEVAAGLLQAIAFVREKGADAFEYDPHVEDLFFAVEGELMARVGADIGGNLQIARSRNDLAAALNRMVIRHRLLDARQCVVSLREVLIDIADEHIDSLMPGITHTQPAQPTTLAHYLLGVLGPLDRDSTRLAAAFSRTNISPLGVAAFTTTSFPIDRNRSADLLGFDGYISNGYDAVGGGDYLVEAVQGLVNCVGSLSRFVYDLLVWSRRDVGYVRIDDAFIQISSIMPQKRNPVVLEHVRTRIAWVYGDATAVQTMVHSAAFGDTNDVEDPIMFPATRAFDAFTQVVETLTEVLKSATFDTVRMMNQAGSDFSTTTALADALVREHGLPFRTAHHVVSQVVNEAMSSEEAISSAMVQRAVDAERVDGLTITDAFVNTALDPQQFVDDRTIDGGPAPVATRRALSCEQTTLAADKDTLARDRRAITDAATRRHERVWELTLT